MSKNKKVIAKKPALKIAKGKKKTVDEFHPDDESEDPLDHVIDELERSLEKPTQPTNNKKSKLRLDDFLDLEASESPKSTKKVRTNSNAEPKLAKVWSPAEAALLKLLITGSPPFGRNSSGIKSE